MDLPVGDAALLMVLAASASYIAVPAVLRYAIPEANPSLYFGLSLGVTFPLNILFGIALYTQVAVSVLNGTGVPGQAATAADGLRAAGFDDVAAATLTGGIVALHTGRRPAP